MKWQTKAKIHSALDRAPFGSQLYYLLQRRVIGSLPRKYDPKYLSYLEWHRQNITSGPNDLARTTVFEFGVGWDLFYNIALYCYGCDKQILVDLNRFAKIELINHEIDRLSKLDNPGFVRRPPGRIRKLDDLAAMGIDYRAPADARDTGLPPESVDVVISTNTMEHVPFDDLAAILREAHRLLRRNGIISARVDYADHYYYADKSMAIIGLTNPVN